MPPGRALGGPAGDGTAEGARGIDANPRGMHQGSEGMAQIRHWVTGDVVARVPFGGLAGADLRGSKLCGADLREADLTAADLSFASLTSANLEGADLRQAN